jgi:vacuolar-type H+-ATPase subunit I/STV1
MKSLAKIVGLQYQTSQSMKRTLKQAKTFSKTNCTSPLIFRRLLSERAKELLDKNKSLFTVVKDQFEETNQSIDHMRKNITSTCKEFTTEFKEKVVALEPTDEMKSKEKEIMQMIK